ncbi:MAG TPA: methyl-accepting chemotaxis protein [Noviherbaspirillum sp.]
MQLSHLTIGKKLGAMAAVNALLTLVLAVSAYQALASLVGQWEEFRNVPLKKMDLISEGRSHLGDTIQEFKNYLLRGKDYDARFLKNLAEVEQVAAAYARLGTMTEKERSTLDSIGQGIAVYRTAIGKAVEMKARGAGIEEIDQSIAGADKPLKKAFEDLMDVTRQQSDSSAASITSIVSNATITVLAVTMLTVLLGAALSAFGARSITRPLRRALEVAQAVAAGDLSSDIQVRSHDETGQLMQALKEMNENLAKIIGEVRNGSAVVREASQQIAAGNAELSSRTEEQASSLEETAASMEELTTNVKQNVDNARQAHALAASACDVAGRGGAVVTQVVQTMSSINASSKKIVDIISVIDGIAFQTNILALNAAVEAARAGEQGRGFAVVASEVRVLAQRSASAAKEIKALISDSVEKVETGSKLVEQAGATMTEIVDGVLRVNQIMGQIMAASEEQGAGIEEINRAIVVLDQVAQQNAALVEEAASAAESLQDQARNMDRAASVFKLQALTTVQATAA